MKNKIHVAACCDDNYVAYAAVMMMSALESTANSLIHFHLVDCGIEDRNLELLHQTIMNCGGQLTTYKPDNSIYQGLPTHRYGPAVYHRIQLPVYLPPSITRVIYIDSDTLVLDDLEQLWNTDLEGNPVAAVENFSPYACRNIGFDRKEYFNSGVLLIDLQLWRAESLHSQVDEFARENAGKLQFVDQCSLNAVLRNRWTRLPASWNMQADIYKVIKKNIVGCSYTKMQLEQAARAPGIVHFIGTEKPWKIYCFSPFKSKYRAFLRKTPWKHSNPPDNTLNTRIRFLFSLERHLKYWLRKHRISI